MSDDSPFVTRAEFDALKEQLRAVSRCLCHVLAETQNICLLMAQRQPQFKGSALTEIVADDLPIPKFSFKKVEKASGIVTPVNGKSTKGLILPG